MSTFGDLTKTEQWSADGNNSYSYYTYTSQGNLLTSTDSLGNTKSFTYDESGVYPQREINALGHITTYDYNASFGVLNSVTKNDITTYYAYDVFGRISKEIQPYDTSSQPTKSYAYYFDGTAPEYIVVSSKTTADKHDDSRFYYDGQANLIQLKADIENNQQVVKNIYYDSQFRISSEDNPYFDTYSATLSTPLSSPSTNYSYDCMDRVIRVTNPDGTAKRVTFDRYNITDYDENSHYHTYQLDAYGRIATVLEHNTDGLTGLNETYTTTYDYDATDNLIKITDTLGNEFQFTYDSFGRKTATDDPDLGHWEYKYDLNGNLVQQTEARNYSVNLTYDALNRITLKKSINLSETFAYDSQYYGTLSNQSLESNYIVYSYDKRMRVIQQEQLLLDQVVQMDYLYDAQNRLISNDNLDYFYNKQGSMRRVSDYINNSAYDAFGALLNVTYGNGIVTRYSYDAYTHRLTNIQSTVQNLSYTYDNVGNIMTIHDAMKARVYNMTYDGLYRLISAQIGSDTYLYSYNPTGNILKIVKNNESKKFVYGGLQAHAPSKIIEGSAGVDVHNPKEIPTTSKSRVFEFFLINEKNSSVNANWSMAFGDGTSVNSNQNISINASSDVWVFVQNNYSHGGEYDVNFSAASPGTSDTESANIKFGLKADSLSTLYTNISQKTFEFKIKNEISDTVTNVEWACSENISSMYKSNLTGSQTLFDYIQHNYISMGEKTLQCLATSDDGNDSLSIDFTIPGVEIQDYDVLSSNVSRQVVAFNVVNNYHALQPNISVDADTHHFSTLANLSNDQTLMVFTEVNYSSDDANTYQIGITANGTTDEYQNTFKLEGSKIENYQRSEGDNGKQILMFDVKNNWHPGYVSWNISNPAISNATYLNTSESVMIILEQNYSDVGNNIVSISAQRATYIDRLTDSFTVKPLEIQSFQTLEEGLTSIFEIVAKNNLEANQTFGWKLDTGIANITSNTSVNLANTTFIFIEATYPSEAVYRTTAAVNTTQHSDSENGVVIP